MADVAIVGVGIMGRGMAENLLKHGHRVILWNRTPEKVADLREAGAEVADTPAAAAARAEVVFEVTADDESSRRVWLGPEGILDGVRDGTVLVASATLSVDWVAELAGAVAERGLPFYDMPLTGGAAAARAGTLVLLVGGDQAGLAKLEPVLQAFSREVRYFGPAGSGTRFKLVLNSLQAAHMAAFGEALRLAVAAGLDPEAVGAAFADRPGGAVTQLAWASHRQSPDPINFAARLAHKDLTYAARLAGDLPHPILDSVRGVFGAAVEAGHGDDDWSSVNEL
ncbi:NAD(P)-dependent oxidoreductase [Catenulispora pinisilvae]|uniref:NAD(P)-dependent oxidoreductase n=1 Tax=Catenulispora pinisilvae TaxID=2705253 RepID=UPI0018912B0D|nr:NAD(P)-dependent oxidoreductase [Catenulispora pinisilvae]